MIEDSQYSTPSEASPVRMAPPTAPGVPQRKPHVWPAALGIVLIVLGAGAMLGGAWSAVGSIALSQVALHADGLSPLVEDMGPLSAIQVVAGVFGALLGGLCLAAGIGLLRRRIWGVPTARVWAILKILYGVVTSAAIALFQFDLMSSVTNYGAAPPPPGFGGAFFGAFAVVFFVMSLCWLVALPVFVLLWLRRSDVALEIARWRKTPLPEAR